MTTSEPQLRDTGQGLWAVPEVSLALFSFAFHFIWEFLQIPTFEGMAELRHWEGVKICTYATVGDVGIALAAFWITSLAARTRHWICHKKAWQLLVFLIVGIVITIGLEFYYVEISNRWSYSELMPLVPPFGTGLSPLLQWIVVPLLVVELTRRNLLGTSKIVTER
ncbi:hypothetical protein [Aurantimonas marianensis]|uniref:Uncharacterized protein n=1 Tax=Aurantimonas marianensis TaxID=2920428 RepID=A0A9X2HDG0_9HYPH|nr:hypothetical protein [Aurantimonas marianensis]MCP3055579.1 hypothetical protein [Aurantimonas marianensis]